jgi:hypothetical protein
MLASVHASLDELAAYAPLATVERKGSLTPQREDKVMTKKHFIALADAIRINGLGTMFTDYVVDVLADFCQTQNRNFNRERWIAYIKGECGPNGGKR